MICYLGLGSNLGDKEVNLQKAREEIEKECHCGLDPQSLSSVYETEPWGFHSENSFLNQVIRIDTPLSPIELLKKTQAIEKSLGREQKTKDSFEDRIIDIDILLYGDLILHTEGLRLPHPLLHERDFVLKGLNELAPDLVHPVLKKSIAQLYKGCLHQ